MVAPMTDDDRLKLLYGPYAAPNCKRGDTLTSEWVSMDAAAPD